MRWLIASALLLAACASTAQSGIEPPAQLPARVDPTSGGYDIRLNHAESATGEVFAAPVDRVWPIAVAAYTAAGLRIDGSDQARHILQTRGQTLRRQLNGRSLSLYFDCGSDLAGNIADSWRLRLDGNVAVTPATTPDSTRLQTLLSVTASPVEGTSAQVTPCASKGRLELEIARIAREALARQQPQ